MISFTLGELAKSLDCQLVGDPSAVITGVSTIEKAGADQVTFLANVKYTAKAKATRAGAVIAAEPLTDTGAATLVSENPYHDFARALALFYQPPKPPEGIHPTAVIDPSARIGEGASIGAYTVVGANTVIGAHVTLHPHVVIYGGCAIGDHFTAHSHVSIREYTRIGNRVTIHNNVVIGGDGFGFAKDKHGAHRKIPQSGIVVIEDDVEIQTLTSVDRASLGETRIKRGAKIDSLVQIGHACTVGEDNIICAQTGLAGSTTLEADVIMAGQTGSSGHLTIHKGAIVWAQSGVGHDVAPGTIVAGSPAFNHRDWLRACAAYPKIADVFKTVRTLERRVAELENTKRTQDD